jgi:hypothetical protein
VRPGITIVDHDDVRLKRRHGIEYSTTVLHRGHKVTLAGEEVAQRLTDMGLVVGDQDTGTRRLRLHLN